MNRREFSALLPALLSAAALLPEAAQAAPAPDAAPAALPALKSGVYPPGPPYGSQPGRSSRRLIAGGMLPNNIRCEAHVSTIEPGTPHEAVGTHLHSEIWYVTEGTPTLMTNGVERLMNVGDLGICAAGDTHYIANYSKSRCSYFVITAGPPEPPPQAKA
jgi:mannose-6-phosphate isomerase-like protein (cupin superfamily)